MFIVHCEITRMIKEWHFRWKIWQMWWWRQRRGAVPRWRLLIQKSIFGGGYHGRIWTRVRTHWLIGMLSRKNKGKIFLFWWWEKLICGHGIMEHNTQINLLSQNGTLYKVFIIMYKYKCLYRHLHIFRDQSYTSFSKGT